MRSVRCDVCGTKALMAASQCPKCSHPLAFRDGFGELLPLAHCPTCDSDYPLHQGACKWCGTAPAKTAVGPNIWKYVGIGAFVSMGIGAWLARGEEEPPRKAVILASSSDSTSADGAQSGGRPQLAFARPDSFVDTNRLPESTTVVAVDSLPRGSVTSETVALESTGAVADTPRDVATGAGSLAPDSAPAALDSPLDSARVREPWLPPPSVIRRSPPPVTATTQTTTVAAPPETVAPPPPSATTSRPSSASTTTRVAVAPPPSNGRSAPSAAAPPASRAKPKASPKAVAKAPPRKATTRTAASSTSTPPRKAAPPPARSTAAAKPPAAISRKSGGWVNSVARGWTVVRASANGRARIIGSIGPDTRVQLGETRGGFRRIKARGLAGWVDARAYFVAITPRRAGRLASQ